MAPTITELKLREMVLTLLEEVLKDPMLDNPRNITKQSVLNVLAKKQKENQYRIDNTPPEQGYQNVKQVINQLPNIPNPEDITYSPFGKEDPEKADKLDNSIKLSILLSLLNRGLTFRSILPARIQYYIYLVEQELIRYEGDVINLTESGEILAKCLVNYAENSNLIQSPDSKPKEMNILSNQAFTTLMGMSRRKTYTKRKEHEQLRGLGYVEMVQTHLGEQVSITHKGLALKETIKAHLKNESLILSH